MILKGLRLLIIGVLFIFMKIGRIWFVDWILRNILKCLWFMLIVFLKWVFIKSICWWLMWWLRRLLCRMWWVCWEKIFMNNYFLEKLFFIFSVYNMKSVIIFCCSLFELIFIIMMWLVFLKNVFVGWSLFFWNVLKLWLFFFFCLLYWWFLLKCCLFVFFMRCILALWNVFGILFLVLVVCFWLGGCYGIGFGLNNG